MRKRLRISHTQSTLPFNESRTRALATPFQRERRALVVLGALVVATIVVYGTCVAASVREIALRQDALVTSRATCHDVIVESCPTGAKRS